MNRREFVLTSGVGGILSSFKLHEGVTEAFKVGFSEADISPKVGMERPGGYGKSYFDSFHDPCKARVALFDDGASQVVLVSVDALVVPKSLVDRARATIQQRCGIPGRCVLIGASHSHSSGPVGMVQPGQYDHAPELVRRLAYEKSSCADPEYLRQVEHGIVEATVQAFQNRVHALCGVGKGHEDQVAFNRRFRMKNGLTYTHPGQGNPDIVEVAGPTDPDVGVIGAWNLQSELIGCVVNYACHATTSPEGISANWIYYLERTIRGGSGSDVPVVFLPGACGDITQVDNLSPYTRKSGDEEARFVGGRVGGEVLKVLTSVETGILTPLNAASRILRVKRRVPRPERVQECLEIVKHSPTSVGQTKWTFSKEIVLLDALLATEPEVDVEVQAVQVGPAVFVTNPAELFCELGLRLKAASSFPFTFVVELANGSVGYVPTREAFGEHGGGYETRLTSYSNLEIEAGNRIVEAGVELTRMMNPGSVPVREKVSRFSTDRDSIGRAAWSYGNVPPELD